ncbi:cell division protein FtsQ/DivIB [Nocardioides marmorisolisilvae]|uniref:FtsQ-type POTRA domain-containing protein n=1 Tax=Nocardioides marmorisolisilvae TaxID=1542737 RepID=A0A3N0DVX9_9ACTN|nr:FtsQ-type POTRA domain-containing protein [Nocardioides marmorisolisilvae]RNL79721.1 FtsQ-type POTRA domain-containing protein [Nocardioides marmorisolisilvae]
MTMTDDETVVVAAPTFKQRRWTARLRRWRPFLIIALALALVVTGIWLVFYSSVASVRGVEVVGNHRVTAQHIRSVARAPIGTPLARADLAAVQARVEAIPDVSAVSVSRSWLHTIRIEVTERVPVAVVSRDSGTAGAPLQAVDLDGVLFGSFRSRPKGLPLIRTAPGVTAEVLSEAAKVVTSLRSDIASRVRYVDVASIDKITLSLRNGPQVLWGSADDSEEKADVLAVFLNGGSKKYTRIDVSVPGKPTTR